MPPVAPRKVRVAPKRLPFSWMSDYRLEPPAEPRAPWAEPWTPSPVAKAAMDFAAEEPEMAVVVVAFLVGLLCPCRERMCEKVIVACCDHRSARAKKEKKP